MSATAAPHAARRATRPRRGQQRAQPAARAEQKAIAARPRRAAVDGALEHVLEARRLRPRRAGVRAWKSSVGSQAGRAAPRRRSRSRRRARVARRSCLAPRAGRARPPCRARGTAPSCACRPAARAPARRPAATRAGACRNASTNVDATSAKQDDERVHPRLLRVVRQERVDRGQQRGDPRRRASPNSARAPKPRDRDGGQREERATARACAPRRCRRARSRR